MKTIGYAIVGTGYFGAELGRIMARLEGAKIVAILDPENGGTIADEFGCAVESSLEALCGRSDIAAVIVASPNYLHKEPVICAARHKKHIFCEKPIALSYQDCDEMLAAAQDNGVQFMAGHIMNFFNAVRTAKKLIGAGRIGKVLYCHSARNGWEPPQESVSWKKMRNKSGGHLYHHIHELDCIQFIMGAPERVTMVGGNVAHQEGLFGDEDDMLFLTLEFADGRYALLEYGSAFRWSEHYLLIQGTEGAIHIDMRNVGMTLRTGDGDEHYLVHETREEDDERHRIYNSLLEVDGAVMYGKPGKKPPTWLHGIMCKEMELFNRLIHGETIEAEFRPLIDGLAARMAIATADAAMLSINENRKVELAEIIQKL